jgi:hypothetical protein
MTLFDGQPLQNFDGMPTTKEEAKRQRYGYMKMGQCRGCGAPIEWWLTALNKFMPVEPHETEFKSHFATCPQATDFRRARKTGG